MHVCTQRQHPPSCVKQLQLCNTAANSQSKHQLLLNKTDYSAQTVPQSTGPQTKHMIQATNRHTKAKNVCILLITNITSPCTTPTAKPKEEHAGKIKRDHSPNSSIDEQRTNVQTKVYCSVSGPRMLLCQTALAGKFYYQMHSISAAKAGTRAARHQLKPTICTNHEKRSRRFSLQVHQGHEMLSTPESRVVCILAR